MSRAKTAQPLTIEHEPPTGREAQPPAVVTDSGAVLHAITRAAADPAVDVEKMERLTALYDRMKASAAREAYDAAFAKMQPKLPTIGRNGQIIIRDKNNAERIIQTTSYALFEDIAEAIRPILAKHGFGVSFRTGRTEAGLISATCILSHERGHREETTLELPHDSSGSKNAVQAVGSSTAYGKRYTLLALLNITSRHKVDADDDGQAGGAERVISDEQEERLRELLTETRSNVSGFLALFDVESVSDLPAARFDEALEKLLTKKAQQKLAARQES